MTVAPDPGEPDPLVENIRLLAGRVTLAESIIRRLRIVVKVLCVLVVAFVAMTVVIGLVARNNHHLAIEAHKAAVQAQSAQDASASAQEQQKVVSCNDANKNRLALVSLFDFIEHLAQSQSALTGKPVSAEVEQLVTFGRETFAQRDCAQEAATRSSSTTTTKTSPGG